MRKAAGPWKLYSRWLVDSDKYNEWMNEIDYETDDAAAEQDAILGASASRVCWRNSLQVCCSPSTQSPCISEKRANVIWLTCKGVWGMQDFAIAVASGVMAPLTQRLQCCQA